MNTKQNTWYLQNSIWWIIIIGVACVVYVTGIAHESLWFDEAFSYKYARCFATVFGVPRENHRGHRGRTSGDVASR